MCPSFLVQWGVANEVHLGRLQKAESSALLRECGNLDQGTGLVALANPSSVHLDYETRRLSLILKEQIKSPSVHALPLVRSCKLSLPDAEDFAQTLNYVPLSTVYIVGGFFKYLLRWFRVFRIPLVMAGGFCGFLIPVFGMFVGGFTFRPDRPACGP